MKNIQLIQRFAHNDTRLILRDPMLATLLVVVALMGIGVRFAIPMIDRSLAENGVLPNASTSFRFVDTYPMFVAFIAFWQAALLPGTVFGFLLLDEKEDRTLTALRVVPIPFELYIGYRVALPTILAFAFALSLPAIMGESIAPLPLVALASNAALAAPIAALSFALFADNKIQGLAFTKFGGVAGLTLLIGYFLPEPGQWALGVFPPFLVAKSYWLLQLGHSGWWYGLPVASIVQLGLLRLLVARFRLSTSPSATRAVPGPAASSSQ